MTSPYDPNAYQHLPGALPLRLVNVPPHRGERLIGYIPFGLSGLRGFNMVGKSLGLDALEAVAVPRLEAGALVPTRGEERLEVHYGGWGLVLYAEPEEGQPRKRTQRTKGDASDGPIVTLAPEVLSLRTADNTLDPEVRRKRRLKALLSFCPVEVTDERLEALLPGSGVDAFLHREFRSLLDAAEHLAGPRGILNARALDRESEAARALAEENEAAGAVKAVLTRGAGVLTGAETMTLNTHSLGRLESRLEQADPDAPDRYHQAEREHARLEERRERYVAELARRTELRAAHGERPDTSAAEEAVASLVEERDAHERRIGELRQQEAAAARAARAADERVLEEEVGVTRAHDRWRTATENLRRLLTEHSMLPPLAAYELLADELSTLLIDLTAAITRGRRVRDEADALIREVEEARVASRATDALRESADTALTDRSIELEAARQQLAAWEEVETLLASDLSGPSDEDVEASAAALEALRTEAELSRLGVEYRQAVAEHETRAATRQALEEEAKRLRAEVGATWTRLGEVVSDAIRSDVVRVGVEGAVEVLYDGTWYDAEDVQGLSGGALCRALLELYIERTRGPATVRLARELSELVVLPMDGPNRRRISALAAAKELRMVFEMPVDADGESIEVVHYGGQP